jgi:type I restriction enzyme, R subunit
VGYVLRNYIDVGLDELNVTKLSTLLTAKYGSFHAAQEQLGSVQDKQSTFVDFQQYLYAADVN